MVKFIHDIYFYKQVLTFGLYYDLWTVIVAYRTMCVCV